MSWPGCRTEDVRECLYGEQGKWGRCDSREEIGDAECASMAGSEATVGSVLGESDDVRCFLLCGWDRGELCDGYPLRG